MQNLALTDNEYELITCLRSKDRDTATEALRRIIWEYLAPMWEDDEPSVNNPKYNNPALQMQKPQTPLDPETGEIITMLRALPPATRAAIHMVVHLTVLKPENSLSQSCRELLSILIWSPEIRAALESALVFFEAHEQE